MNCTVSTEIMRGLLGTGYRLLRGPDIVRAKGCRRGVDAAVLQRRKNPEPAECEGLHCGAR